MAILVDKNTRVIVQGITGSQGTFHTERMKAYGTSIVAGVTPGKGGQEVLGIPVYNSVKEALEKHEADFSIVFVPAPFCRDAALEALDSNLNVVVITEGVPVHDELQIVKKAQEKNLVLIGPNCPGIISPGQCKLGIMPGHIFSEGTVGMISRSGTLTYEIINELTRNGIGQSTAIGIGGDPIIGTNFIQALEFFEKDKATSHIVVIGEIGGDAEEKAAQYIKDHVTKPVVAYIAGRTAPPGKRMGHAGAVISGNTGTPQAKVSAFSDAGVPVADLPSQIVDLIKGSPTNI